MLDRIKELCKNNRMSLSALEKAAGLSCGSLCRWDENRPSVDKVAAVARVLNTTVDYLVNGGQR